MIATGPCFALMITNVLRLFVPFPNTVSSVSSFLKSESSTAGKARETQLRPQLFFSSFSFPESTESEK